MAPLPPDPSPADSPARRRTSRRRRAAAPTAAARRFSPWVGRALARVLPLALLAALSAGAASLGLMLWSAATGADPYRLGAPGAHHEGDPLPPRHPLLRPVGPPPGMSLRPGVQRVADAPLPAEPPLAYRQRCVWGKPGSNPYRGTVVQALQSARLPDEVVRQVAARVAARQRSDRVEIRREGIRALGSGRQFDARRVALTYGETLCLDARVNFVAGHMEPADLYEAADAAGRVYAVMVPEVCGNVSVLSQQGERRRPRLLATADEGPPGPLRRLPAALEDGGGEGFFAFADDPHRHDVPEPGTLACVALALAALGWFSRRR